MTLFVTEIQLFLKKNANIIILAFLKIELNIIKYFFAFFQ